MGNWKGVHLAVDFDGTIHEYFGWPGHEGLGKPIAGAAEWLKKWVDGGGIWSVFSARAKEPNRICMMRFWLDAHGFPQPEDITNVKSGHFDWYIDDKAVQYDGEYGICSLNPKAIWDFTSHAKDIGELRAWWKNVPVNKRPE